MSVEHWKAVSEVRALGMMSIRVTLSNGIVTKRWRLPYYDELTEQSMFKAVARGHTDPRWYCMGCGVDEGELHEHWCHAVKEAHRKKTSHLHDAAAFTATAWHYQACKSSGWRWVFWGAGEALCPDCGGRVMPPKLLTGEDGLVKRDIPPPPPDAPKWTAKIGEPRVMRNPRVSDLLLNALGEVTVLASGTHIATSPMVQPGHVAHAVFAPGGQMVFLADWHGSDHGYVYVTALQRDGTVQTDWFCEACGCCEGEKHRGGESCPGLQKMHSFCPDVPGVELLDRSAVAKAPGFSLRPPKRELVVMVDDQSEPP